MSNVMSAWRLLIEKLALVGLKGFEFAEPVSRDALEAAASRFGMPFHPDVVALYRCTGGHSAGQDEMPPPMYVDVMFPSVDQAVDTALGLRESAALQGSPPGLWRDSWLPVFVLWADHVVAVDCEGGGVWFVWWEDTRIVEVAPDLARFLESWADLVDALPARYDEGSGRWIVPAGFDEDTVPSTPW